MDFKKREAELERIFCNNRLRLATLSDAAPINKQIVFKLSCLAWHFKQRYRNESVAYYVAKRDYEADLSKVKALEDELIQGGDSEAEAKVAIAEAREYLELIAGYRVRNNKKTRVY